MRKIIVLAVFCAVIASAAAADLVIRNGKIMTVTNGTFEGTILIRDGKIAAVGAEVEIPADAEVIDAAGKWVTPGLIDCHSHIAADSINEGAVAVSSMTGIEDVLDNTDINIYRDLAGGVTTANILHGSANPIGGKNEVIKLRWGKSRNELTFEGSKPGIKFALGENPKRRGSGTGDSRRYPASRMGVEDVIREAFQQAVAYRQEWRDYEAKKSRGMPVIPPRRDLTLEPLVEILDGKRLVHAHCYRADEILMLIRVANDFGFRIATFQHVLEGYKVAKEIAEHGAGASTFSDWWAYKLEAYDAIPYNAAIMTRKGVLVSINSDSAEEARHLNQEAAKTMRYGGLTEDEALALVTINPARQLQIDDRVGSIEVGKDADLVIFNHNPLSVYAVPEKVFIDGQLYYSTEMEQQRLDRLAEEKKSLEEIEKSYTSDRKESGGEPTQLSGSWEVTVSAPEQTYRAKLDLSERGGVLTGRIMVDGLGSFDIFDGSVDGNRFSFKFSANLGEGPVDIVMEATASGDRFSGTAAQASGGDGAVPMEGRRSSAPGSIVTRAGGGR